MSVVNEMIQLAIRDFLMKGKVKRVENIPVVDVLVPSNFTTKATYKCY